MSMIFGYSERGLINSLFYEIKNHQTPVKLINCFLGMARFANEKVQIPNAGDYKILIEQSFSDFGDADAVLLLDGEEKTVVFLEAKVNCPI